MTYVGNLPGRITGKRSVLNLSPTFTPFHVYGFSLKALDTLLVKHGFTIEERTVWASPKVPAGRTIRTRSSPWWLRRSTVWPTGLGPPLTG